jgi:hypothetical protein
VEGEKLSAYLQHEHGKRKISISFFEKCLLVKGLICGGRRGRESFV